MEALEGTNDVRTSARDHSGPRPDRTAPRRGCGDRSVSWNWSARSRFGRRWWMSRSPRSYRRAPGPGDRQSVAQPRVDGWRRAEFCCTARLVPRAGQPADRGGAAADLHVVSTCEELGLRAAQPSGDRRGPRPCWRGEPIAGGGRGGQPGVPDGRAAGVVCRRSRTASGRVRVERVQNHGGGACRFSRRWGSISHGSSGRRGVTRAASGTLGCMKARGCWPTRWAGS